MNGVEAPRRALGYARMYTRLLELLQGATERTTTTRHVTDIDVLGKLKIITQQSLNTRVNAATKLRVARHTSKHEAMSAPVEVCCLSPTAYTLASHTHAGFAGPPNSSCARTETNTAT